MVQKRCNNCVHVSKGLSEHPCSVCGPSWVSFEPMELTKQQLEEKLAFGINGTASYDVVSKPKHYMLFDEMEVKERAFEGQGVEVRDVIEKLSWKLYQSGQCAEVPLFISDYVQMMQYLMRFMDKNGKEDLEKAKFYLDKLIESY